MSTDWTALFLRAPSPGQIFRVLQRRLHAGDAVPDHLLLSEPTLPDGWRALTTFEHDREGLEGVGSVLSLAFRPRVALVYSTPGIWGVRIWENGVLITEEQHEADSPSPLARLLEKLPGGRPAFPPAYRWARDQGFPAQRVPGALPSRLHPPIVDYRTVAALDQRSLLVENEPKLYRLRWSDGV